MIVPKKLKLALMVAVAAVLIYILFFRNRSGYSLSPGSIQTNLPDTNGSIFDLPTGQQCIAGNTAPGQDGSNESYYTKMDGAGYGVCGAESFVKGLFGYQITSDESALGDGN